MAAVLQSLAEGVDRCVSEGCGVMRVSSFDCCCFGCEALKDMTNSHSGGDAVRVNNKIGDDALDRKGKVFCSFGHAAGSFLAMPRCKFISNLRDPHRPGLNFGKLPMPGIFRQKDDINNGLFSPFGPERGIFNFRFFFFLLNLDLRIIFLDSLNSLGEYLACQYLIIHNKFSRLYDPIVI